jgi:branched-chain amino acid transport system substrate-binding protein
MTGGDIMNLFNCRTMQSAVAMSILVASHASAADPIKIGLVMPFSGPAAAYGIEARQAAELAVDETNAAGGVAGGRMLRLVYEDDKGTPQGSVGATQKQISVNRVDAIVGGMGSQLALAQASVANNRILYVNSAAQADAITEQGNKWLFQINNTTNMNAAAFNKYVINTMKPKTVAFIGENTEFARPLLSILKRDLAAAKIELVNVSLYDTETNDFTSIITKVRSLNPELVYVADGAPARLVQFWKQARQLGGFRAGAVTPGVVTPTVLKASEGAMDGVISGDIFFATDNAPETQSFVKAFRKKYNADPGKVHLVVYEGVKVIAGAMEKAKTSSNYAALAQTMRENTWNTPRGTLRFDAQGRAHAPYFYIQRVKGASLELVSRWQN